MPEKTMLDVFIEQARPDGLHISGDIKPLRRPACQHRWIPVGEQRPPVGVRVWFFTHIGCRYIGRLNEDGSTIVDYAIIPGPQGIAKMWQPLPKPPEEVR